MLKLISEIFFPPTCVICGEELVLHEKIVCAGCLHTLPLTRFSDYKDNDLTRVFEGLIKLEYGMSLFYYKKEGSISHLIHSLKYKGTQAVGEWAGNRLGEMMKNKPEFREIDLVLPVPLHPKKKRKRGYNQLTKFGKALAGHLDVPYREEILLKKLHTDSQTKKNRAERFSKAQGSFYVNPEYADVLRGKHILLIDDVVTTGATLESCGSELLKIEGTALSVATIAVSHHL